MMMRLVGSKENQNYESKGKFIVRVSKVNAGSHLSQEYTYLQGGRNMWTMKPTLCVSQAFEGIRECNFMKENFCSRHKNDL